MENLSNVFLTRICISDPLFTSFTCSTFLWTKTFCDVTRNTDTLTLPLPRPGVHSTLVFFPLSNMWKVRPSISFSRKLKWKLLREAVNRRLYQVSYFPKKVQYNTGVHPCLCKQLLHYITKAS